MQLVLFKMDGCPHCSPLLARGSRLPRHARVADVQRHAALADALGVRAVPALFAVGPGDRVRRLRLP